MSKVYVDPTVITDWKARMAIINDNCITSIEEIDAAVSKLNDSLQGDYATQYEESFGKFTKQVKATHESLKDVENFLNTVITVMENQ